MENLQNTTNSRKKVVIIFITAFIFISLLAPGVTPRISAVSPVEEDFQEEIREPIEDDEVSIEDYLDEWWLRHLAKSMVSEKAKNDKNLELPTPEAKAVFSAQVVGKVALTFDDGPYEGFTEKYLEVLKDHGVGATFFLVGNRIERFPEQAQKIVHAGFDVGLHSYSHAQLTKKDATWIERDFERSIAALKNVAEVDAKLFRPPYGDYNDTVLQVATNRGLHTLRWNVDPRDWQEEDPRKIVDNILTYSSDGSIILLHEGRRSTLEALPQIIQGLRARGFEIVSVSELLSAEEATRDENNT